MVGSVDFERIALDTNLPVLSPKHVKQLDAALVPCLICQWCCTKVLRVDCRDPCHGRLDAARLVHYLSCEIIRTFGMPYKMPDRPGLSSRRVGNPEQPECSTDTSSYRDIHRLGKRGPDK